VAFKIAQALLEKTGRARLIPSFLKMVAIATIADAVPLTGENRVFAKLGLDGLRMPVNAGLKALMDVAELTTGRGLTVTDVAFRLAPRLNAAGRMDVARDVVDLFTLRDGNVVRELAERLNRLNLERQQEEARIMAEIHGRVEREPELRDAWCIVVDGEGWHKGVIGIAATRVVERWNKPALVITRDGYQAQGSGRSIEAFHLLDALESCAPLFTRFGGHAFAAGFALPAERIGELRQALDARARAMLTQEDLQPVMKYDGELDLNAVTPELFRDVLKMEPFGMGNPEPKFAARGVLMTQPPKLLKDRHAKLFLTAAQPKQNGNGTSYRRSFAAMGWRLAERATSDALAPGDALDVVYSITENLHPDFGGIELCLHDYVRAEKTAGAGL
jgi:single-stranded-DNA-specific exonuclease